ncbi:hypothetical protein O4H26_13020 [Aequorivita viscosa]|nr:hypothetical protein [Aequorivita viscosa]
MSKKSVHRGEILENAIKVRGIAIKVAASKAGYSRSSYYKHIDQKDLSLHILIRYGSNLEIDFSKDIPELNSIDYSESGNPKTLKEALNQNNILKEKYYSLLEKYNELLESRN